MNVNLFDFQTDCVAVFLERLASAKRYVAEGQQEAVLLTAPTGSGKTVMLTAAIEGVLNGAEKFRREPNAVFLWLSDQPELNEQSRRRLMSASSLLLPEHLIVIGSGFDERILTPGRVYFLNTQKLARNSLLVRERDLREYTIWETLRRTREKLGDRFYLIIDEAHRGMTLSSQAQKEAQSIVQRFLLGSPSDKFPAMELVIGVSATPKRFEVLVSDTSRHTFKVTVDPERVRESGLLKDRLIVSIPSEGTKTDWSLLNEACERLIALQHGWSEYCLTEQISVVSPILIVQVADGGHGKISATDLRTAISVIADALPGLGPFAVVHSFQDAPNLEIGGRLIRYVAPSDISNDREIKVVFFKMALNTGWDCPRAEVMMSFRRARDTTSIAQLVGRMVRTPLAQRIIDRDTLNEVHLFLPHYDRSSVEAVLERLRSDPDNVPITDVDLADDLQTLKLDMSRDSAAYELLRQMPTMRLSTSRRSSNVRRLLRYATQLTAIDGLRPEALSGVREKLVRFLALQKRGLYDRDPAFREAIDANRLVKLAPLIVDYSTLSITEGAVESIQINEHSVDELFRRAKLRFSDDVAATYYRSEVSWDDPIRAKLELYLLAQNRAVVLAVEEYANTLLTSLRSSVRFDIMRLSNSRREAYNKISQQARQSEEVFVEPSLIIRIPVSKDAIGYTDHLYLDANGVASLKLDGDEIPTLKALQAADGFYGWIRNLPRKESSLGYTYQGADGFQSIGYPDLLAFRKSQGQLALEVYEPHGRFLSDSWRKAKGMANFVDRNADAFSRFCMVWTTGTSLRVLDFTREAVRARALILNNDAELEGAFRDLGSELAETS